MSCFFSVSQQYFKPPMINDAQQCGCRGSGCRSLDSSTLFANDDSIKTLELEILKTCMLISRGERKGFIINCFVYRIKIEGWVIWDTMIFEKIDTGGFQQMLCQIARTLRVTF